MTDTAERTFLVLLRPGPAWVEGRPMREQDLGAHRDHIARLAAEGRALLAGPFLDTAAGGLVLLRARDDAAARAMMEADPSVRDGVFAAELRPVLPLFGALAAPEAP